MPHNHSPEDISTFTMNIIFALGLIGAVLNFLKRKVRKLSLLKKLGLFAVDTLSSSTLAVISFYGVIGLGYNELLAIAVAGALSHQGTRAIYILELIVAEKFGGKQTFDELTKQKEEQK